ncbi:hypothetical protein ABW19_dt0203149 [Dactylella cylindrospora]|nr:hypothetical protein ABW19_dt0203149 [Dactylella cylindrospora]
MFQLTPENFEHDAPIEELQIASRATNADEWKLYLRWELAYLFTRVRSFDDELLSEILKYSTPQTGSGPPEAAAAAARSYARDCVRQLTTLLAESHRDFANILVERTDLGRLYQERAQLAKNNRAERPRLDTSELSRSLVFSPEDVKALWYPLHFAISGRYFDEDRNSDRYADVRTVLSQTSSWIIREFVNLILLGPTDRSQQGLAGFDIISRSAEAVSVELTRWPEISSSLQKRLEGWQRTLIQGNSYPTKDSPQAEHIWQNLVTKAAAMGQSPLVTTPAHLRPRGSNSPTKQQPYEEPPAAAVYVPDRTSSYASGSGSSMPNKSAYAKQVERLQTQANTASASNTYASNTSRRIDPSPVNTQPNPGFSPQNPTTSSRDTVVVENPNNPAAGSSGTPNANFDEYVRNQFDLQDRTIADAVSYFQRERQRMADVKERLRDLEKQQELLTANYKRQMEDLDRKKREVFDRYQTEKTAPPVNMPHEVAGQVPQQSVVHFDLGAADRHVQTSATSGPVPAHDEYYDEEDWEREPSMHNRKGKLQKMHPEFDNAGPGGPLPQQPQGSPDQQQRGKPRVSWIQRATHAIKR